MRLREAPFTYLSDAEMRQAILEYQPWLILQRRYRTVTQVVTQLFRDSTLIRFDSPVPFTADGFALVRLTVQRAAPSPLDRRADP